MNARRMQIAAGTVALGAALAAAFAQTPPTEGRLCGIEWIESTHGGDVLHTRGELQLGPKMTQDDGGFVIMGQGTAEVRYQVNDGCQVVRGSPFTAKMQVMVSSDDGRTAEIDIIPTDYEFEVSFKCPATVGTMETNAGVSVPPTVSIPLREGARANYMDGDSRAGATGTVSLKYCRP